MSGRLSDWEARLAAYLTEKAQEPYSVENHCLLFPAGAVAVVTGVDLARGHRGKYSTMEGALRYLKRLGFSSPEEMIDSLLPEKPVARAMRGDIVLDEEGIPGVCIGGDALMVTEQGLQRVPRSAWRKAWAV